MSNSMWICDCFLLGHCKREEPLFSCEWAQTRGSDCLNDIYNVTNFFNARSEMSYPCEDAMWNDNKLVKIQGGTYAFERLQNRPPEEW